MRRSLRPSANSPAQTAELTAISVPGAASPESAAQIPRPAGNSPSEPNSELRANAN